MQSCDDLDRQLADHARNLDSLLAFYIGSLREADRLHREFEQAVSDYDWQDGQGVMAPVKDRCASSTGSWWRRCS
jgi:hypothetical protein